MAAPAGANGVTIFLRAQPNSHPFNEREIWIDEKLQKVGRSVAKTRPSNSNLIFDCKVLSRNHAVMWCADGQVFLRDTRSSNGTFVNNARLSGTGEESVETPLKDGDVIQFGVDVMENQRQKVTHGCIIAVFVNPSARAPSPPAEMVSGVKLREVMELAQILADSRHMQETVDNKLSNIQFDLHQTAATLENECKSYIEEDQLLARIETLENQLQFYTQDQGTSEVQTTLKQLEDDKHRCSIKAKESLQSMLQEKMEVLKKYSNLQLDYDQSEQECDRWKSMYEEAQEERRNMAEALDERGRDMYRLQMELDTLRQQHSALEQEHGPIKLQHQETLEKLDQASMQLVSVTDENTFAKDRLSSLQEQMELLHDRNESLQELNDAGVEKVRLRDLEIDALRQQLKEQGDAVGRSKESELANGGIADSALTAGGLRHDPHSRYSSLIDDRQDTLVECSSNNAATTLDDPMATIRSQPLNREVVSEQCSMATRGHLERSPPVGIENDEGGQNDGQLQLPPPPPPPPPLSGNQEVDVNGILLAALMSVVITIYYSLPGGGVP